MRFLTYADYEIDPAQWQRRITPVIENNLEPAGIDLTVGGSGVNVTSGEEVAFDAGEVMEVCPGDFVNI